MLNNMIVGCGSMELRVYGAGMTAILLRRPKCRQLNGGHVLQSCIDHIVITARTLQAGVQAVEQALGVSMQAGGEHPDMGTHNYVLKLGKDVFLEVIAVNPAAASPGRPRWFDLDAADSMRSPRLAAWVSRTTNIQQATALATLPVGTVLPLTRGSLSWRLTVPDDGSRVLQGAAPQLIQWDGDAQPASSMTEQGCALLRLEAFHPSADDVSRFLDDIGFEGPFLATPLNRQAQPYLVAHIQTPAGVRTLGGPDGALTQGT
jgi:hypothetical protein